MVRRSGALPLVLFCWLLRAGPAQADGAFPDSQNIVTPDALPNEILLATNFGVVLSVDGGRTWAWTCEQTLNSSASLYQMGAPPASRLYAVSRSGLIHSEDASCSWSAAMGWPANSTVSDAFADPTDPDRVLAVVGTPAEAGIVYQIIASTDGGRTLDKVLYTAPSGDTITGVEIARSAPATLYLTILSGPAGTPKLAQSTDGGATWQVRDLSASLAAGTNSIRLVAVDRADAQKVFLRVRRSTPTDGGGIPTTESLVVTDDGGLSARAALDLPGGFLVAFTRMPSGTIVVGAVLATTYVAYRSVDGGTTFSPLPAPQPSFRALSSRGGTLYAVGDDAAEFAVGTSTDEGTTWQPLMFFEEVQAIETCVKAECQTDCLSRAGMGQWPSQMCSAEVMPAPVDGGGAGAGGNGGSTHATDASAGHGGPDAATVPGGSGSTGCHCATSNPPTQFPWQAGVVAIWLLGRRRRRAGSRRR